MADVKLLSRREAKLSFGRVSEVLTYDKKSGILKWRIHIPNKLISPGDKAGCLVSGYRKGYIIIGIDGSTYQAHRVAWLLVTGNWPSNQLDHEDLNKTNNKWSNLRLASSKHNAANKPKRAHNTSGFKGVFFRKKTGRYIAYIGGPKTRKHLGCFASPEEAHAVYLAAAQRRWGVFARA